MNFHYIDLENQKNLIEGVILRKLKLHKDQTGSLVETLRTDWKDVYSQKHLPFTMQYLSITPSGLVRDEDKWHVHKEQADRFICVSGRIITALYDPQKNSKTESLLNLFLMGPQKEAEMYLVVIPKNVYHAFMVISKDPGYLLNFPTKLYNPKDEGRVANTHLNWNKVRVDFAINVQR